MSGGSKRALLGISLCAAMLIGGSGSAQAWYKIKNGTPNNVWVSHAFASTTGFLCGWNDNCNDNSTSGWRVEGWWMISPGGTAIVQTQNWGNAQHHIYANDYVGHIWGGNGGGFGTPNTPFTRCEGLFTDLNIPYYTYAKVRGTTCCGGSCTSNYTTTLTI